MPLCRGHSGNPCGVIHDWSKCVRSHDECDQQVSSDVDPNQSQQAVARESVNTDNHPHQDNHGQYRALQTVCDAGDQVQRSAAVGGFGNILDRFAFHAGVIARAH